MTRTRPNTGLRISALVAVAGLFAFGAWRLGIPLPSPDAIRDMFRRWQDDPVVGPRLIPVYLAFIFVFGCVGFPRGPVAAVGIGLMGPWQTYFVYCLILPVSALIQFVVVRWAITDWVRDRLPESVRELEGVVLRHGFWAVAGLRGFPPTGMGAFNALCAVSALKPGTFFAGSVVGYALSSIAYVLLADFLVSIYTKVWDSEWAMPVVAGFIILMVGAMYTLYSQLKKQKRGK